MLIPLQIPSVRDIVLNKELSRSVFFPKSLPHTRIGGNILVHQKYGVAHNNILFVKYIINEVGETVCHRI